MTDEERRELKEIESQVIEQERLDAQERSEKTFRAMEIDVLLTIYEVKKWHKVKGFWEVLEAVDAVRCYYHVWSDVLQEAVLVCEAQKKLRQEKE